MSGYNGASHQARTHMLACSVLTRAINTSLAGTSCDYSGFLSCAEH
jgi:hypothetical protein